MLTFSHVTLEAAHYRWYGARRWAPLLRNISLQVAQGEIVALVGGSGEGKSLLLQCALGLLPKNMRIQGEIRLDGALCDAEQLRALCGHTVSYVPQGVQALNPLLDIEYHLRRTRHLAGLPWDAEKAGVQLNRCKLSGDVLRLFPRQLSGGMAKRVLASHAALSEARYILADELTAWLDASAAEQLLHQLRRLTRLGCGVLWVTHDLMLAAQHADRIVALHQGQICDNVSREQLQQGQIGPQLRHQWAALPERGAIFTVAENAPC